MWSKNLYSRHNDIEYENFMRELLKYLEPIEIESNTIIVNELDEFLEILFFTEGIHKVGYMLNKKETYINVYKAEIKGSPIGMYGVTFYKRSTVIYKTKTICRG